MISVTLTSDLATLRLTFLTMWGTGRMVSPLREMLMTSAERKMEHITIDMLHA